MLYFRRSECGTCRGSAVQVSIQVVELMDHVLSTYDRAISIYTANQFKRAGG